MIAKQSIHARSAIHKNELLMKGFEIMKTTKKYIILFSVIMLLVLSSTNVAVAENNIFSTEKLSDNEIKTVIYNIDLEVLTSEPIKKQIKCFDVNENELIAIGMESFDKKFVVVYNTDGIFQYGYSFNCNGSFGVKWDKNDLSIYLVRSDIVFSVNYNNEIKNVFKINDIPESYSSWNDYIFKTTRLVGNRKYIMKNDMCIFNFFASSFSQLIVTENDTEKIIYNVNSQQFVKYIVCSVLIVIFALWVLLMIISKMKNTN